MSEVKTGTVYEVHYLWPREFYDAFGNFHKKLETGLKTYKYRKWAEKFYKKKRPLSYKITKTEKEILEEKTPGFDAPLTRTRGVEVIKEEPVPQEEVMKYYDEFIPPEIRRVME